MEWSVRHVVMLCAAASLFIQAAYNNSHCEGNPIVNCMKTHIIVSHISMYMGDTMVQWLL